MQILLVGKNDESGNWLDAQLGALGFDTVLMDTVDQALSSNALTKSGAILLNLSAQDEPACHQVQRLRSAGMDHPLLVFSSTGNWRDRVDTLDAGADDFLLKPVRAEELFARLRAVIRRFAGCASNRTRSGDIEMELAARQAWLAGEPLDLTRNEFRLLRLFMLQPEKVHSQRDLQEHQYAGIGDSSTNSLEVQIARLRRKIGKDRIMTVRGMGYRIVVGAMPGNLQLEDVPA